MVVQVRCCNVEVDGKIVGRETVIGFEDDKNADIDRTLALDKNERIGQGENNSSVKHALERTEGM
jgi:hypothetical protein